ncbi:hypothetical protein ACXGQW_01275 [Wenyingzhuangia sp. IMCC45533]
MKIFYTLFRFYVFSNLHVSLSVACLVLVNGKFLGKEVFAESILLGCGTFIAYHLIRYINRFKYGKEHLLDQFSNQHKSTIKLLICIAFGISVFLLKEIEISQLLKILPFGILTLLYAFSFFNVKGVRSSLRYVPFLKIFLIGFVWSGVTVFFIEDLDVTSMLYFIQIMLFVIALTIPFDIRDLEFDRGNVKTIPMLIGIHNTKWVGGVCVVCALLIHMTIMKSYSLSFVLVSIALVFLIVRTKASQSKYFAAFWVEGIPILWLVSSYYI